VRTHALSEKLPDKKVFIHVSGTTAGRRRLLAIIRSEFERIHRDIRNLQPQGMVPVPGHPSSVVSYKELMIRKQQGGEHLTLVVGDDVINLSVQELLNGVNPEKTRRTETATMSEQQQAVRLFYCYARKDKSLRDEMETHLKLLKRQGLIESWHDQDVEAGEEWKRKIDSNLERADIILLLISPDFFDSDYCYEVEMNRALERHERNEARVIPIYVRDVNWHTAPFAKLQGLPSDGVAVNNRPDRDSAWRNVSEGIERVASQIRQHRIRLRAEK
jgi:internalin A